MRLDKLIEEKLETTCKEIRRLFALKQVMIDDTVEFRQNRNVDSLLYQIEVAGEHLKTNESYYLLNKPRKAVTVILDPEKMTVVDLIANADRFQPLYPVGRLDRDTAGLLLITLDGQLGYETLLPEKKVSKTHQVVVDKKVIPADITALENGIVLADGHRCEPADLKILKTDKHQSTILLTVQEGRFHQVKKIFLAQGKKVVALRRLSVGPLELDEQLGVGEYRSLTLAKMKELSIYFK